MTHLVPASYKSDAMFWHINYNWYGQGYYQMEDITKCRDLDPCAAHLGSKIQRYKSKYKGSINLNSCYFRFIYADKLIFKLPWKFANTGEIKICDSKT